MAFIGLRRDHQQRAERLDARDLLAAVSPILAAGQNNQDPTSPSPAPPKDGKSNQPPIIPPIILPVPSPASTPASIADPASASFPSNSFFGPPVFTSVQTLPSTSAVAPPVVVVTPTTSLSVVVTPIVTPSSLSSSSPSLSLLPSSSSSTATVQTTPVVLATPSSQTSVLHTPTTFRSLPQTTYIPSATSFASPSSTSSSTSSGMSTGGIVGIAAASLAGVTVLGILGIYLLKRYFSDRDNDDVAPSSAWMRNSVALADEAPSPESRGPSATPRPPTMIERKQTQSFANLGHGRYLQDQGGYPHDQGQGGYPNDQGGYAQENNVGIGYPGYQDSPYGVQPMPSFIPGQHVGQQFYSPIASPALPSPGAPSFDESMPPMQHASHDGAAMGAPVYFSRRDSNTSRRQSDMMSATTENTPNPHDVNGYATLDRGSVTAYQAQQYAAISKQLSPHASIAEEPATLNPNFAPTAVHEHSPFEDPTPRLGSPGGGYQEFTPPSAAHARVDSSPPILPPMRTLSPVGAVGAQSSIIQIASAFPAAPMSPTHPTFPAAVAFGSPGSSSPRSGSFKQPQPPLSPAPGAQGHVVNVPPAVHLGRETPVQFGLNEVVVGASAAGSASVPAVHQAERPVVPNAKRMSVVSRKSVGKSGRPETMYDEEDAYGGF